MKLITEYTEVTTQNFLEEVNAAGKKELFITGPYMQFDITNRNGRMYPSATLDEEVKRYINDKVNNNSAYGELNHPSGPSIDLNNAAILIKTLQKEGSNWMGKARVITENAPGKTVAGLMEAGGRVGVSSRAMGSLKEKNGVMEVQNDFKIATAADVVADPSAPEAFVNGIMEGVEWFYDAASDSFTTQKVIEETLKTGKRRARELRERKLDLFERFLDSMQYKG